MDAIVNAILNASSEEELKELRDMLRAHEEVLFRNAMQLDELAASLAAPAHTLGLVFVLNVRASALAQASTSPLAAAFVQRCRTMLLDADRAQIALVPAEFSRLCAKFLTFALPLPQGAMLAIKPLLTAVAALQPSPTHITPVHQLALQAAILARCYTAVVPMLATPLVQVDVARAPLCAHDVVLLNYYSGIALVGLKRHREAVEAFQLAITAPALVLNSLMVEAYKKWTLCALITTREAPVLPKYTATVVQRNSRNCAPAYHELASAFVTRDRAKLAKAISQHAATFAKDNNMGLVKQCEVAFLKYAVDAILTAAVARARTVPLLIPAPPARAPRA
jgi:COP9 signalosome complex subunit 3